jgi:glutamine cyclotransferase
MLSLTGKVAALYAQDFDDSVAIEAVNDLEMFATNLSRKIWQKTAILQVALQDAEGAGAVS